MCRLVCEDRAAFKCDFKTMSTNLTINEKLVNIQSELKATKDKYNKFGGYAYRSAEGILEAVKPLLKKYGVSLLISDEVLLIGSRFYIKATATLKSGDETLSTSAFAREEETKKGMDASQLTGSTSSYARKYALNGLFCIDDNKDADTNEYQTQQSAPRAQQKAQQQATQQPAVDNETLQLALSEVRSAQSKESLTEILSRYKMLYQDVTFQTAVREVNAKFKKK